MMQQPGRTMPLVSQPLGQFWWCALATDDLEAAEEFYGGVFGWSFLDSPDGSYRIAMLRGKRVAAFHEGHDDTPRGWAPCLALPDIEVALERVGRLGGEVLEGPADTIGMSGRTVVADPSGAWLCLSQGAPDAATVMVNAPGAMCWNELATDDMRNNHRFYAELAGWQPRVAPNSYTVFQNTRTGRPAAAMMNMVSTVEQLRDRPNWMVHFRVSDPNHTLNMVRGFAGKVLRKITDMADVGRYAVLQDPGGASFSVLEVDED